MGAPFYASKTWWMAIIGLLVPVANQVFGWNMDIAEVSAMLAPITAYIIGEKYRDSKVQPEVLYKERYEAAMNEAPKE